MPLRVALIRRPQRPGLPPRPVRRRLALAIITLAAGLARAEPPPAAGTATVEPEVVAEFTRRVQPLVLNRCAAGACHGSPASPSPRFIRRDPRGGIDRRVTLANLQEFLAAAGPEREANALVAMLAVGHPAEPASPRLVAKPLSPGERITLENWLALVKATERPRVIDPAVRRASATTPLGPPRPNRFKAMLDAAANPPQFPPPQEPQGVILPKDKPPAEEATAAE